MTTHTTLIDAHTLKAHLSDPTWCVVDCRHDLADLQAGWNAYQQGHIPGAVFAPLEDALSGPKTPHGGRHPLPDRAQFITTLQRWGVNQDTQVVAYDAQGGQFAARLWWLLRWVGHARGALLDGGWQAWLVETDLSSSETPAPRPEGKVQAGPSLVREVDATAVLRMRVDAHTRLIDARAPERYRGDVEPIDPVAGHIPGALNRFWQLNLDRGKFKSPLQLRAEFNELLQGSTPQNTIAQCGSGVTACHHLLALEIAGLPGAALYPGSWSEWIRDPARPVEKP
jgi:thiosulfate/3-mercaptopyruvate sulfurtransferase